MKLKFKTSVFMLIFLSTIFIGANISASSEKTNYLVMFDNETTRVQTMEDSSIKGNSTVLSKKINVSKISMTEKEANELRKEKGVKNVIPDLKTKLLADELTWSYNMMNSPVARANGYTGKGVKVAVLDTGIAAHTELVVSGRKDFVDVNGTANDLHRHGTAVAGIIASKANNSGILGVSPDVSLYAVKVMDDSGSGSLSYVVSAIDWCIANGIDIANLSLGVDYSALSDSDKIFFTDFVNDLGQKALDNNLLVVAASGNDGNSTGIDNVNIPARGNGFIAVGAIDSSKRIATFSSIGPSIDVVAPGQLVKTLGLNNTYINGSGTSFASPNIVGLAALYMEKFPNLGAKEIKNIIVSNTEDLGPAGFDNYYGNGLAYFNNNAKEFPITTPNNFKANSLGYNSINISWDSISGAKGYEIYRSTSLNGTYTLLTSTNKLNHIDSNLITDSRYYYKIKAYNSLGDINISSNLSSPVIAKPAPIIPISFKALSSGYDNLSLSWDVVPGASGYEIYRANTRTSTYSLINTISESSYQDNNLDVGTRYYYKIRAYTLVNGTKVYSSVSKAIVGMPVPSRPTSFNLISAGMNNISFSWNNVSGASGYEIYRTNSLTGQYSYIDSISGNTYNDLNLKSNSNYYYKVKSYVVVNGSKIYSTLSPTFSAKTN